MPRYPPCRMCISPRSRHARDAGRVSAKRPSARPPRMARMSPSDRASAERRPSAAIVTVGRHPQSRRRRRAVENAARARSAGAGRLVDRADVARDEAALRSARRPRWRCRAATHRGHAAGSRGRSAARRSAPRLARRGPVTRMPASGKARSQRAARRVRTTRSSATAPGIERVAAELVARKRLRSIDEHARARARQDQRGDRPGRTGAGDQDVEHGPVRLRRVPSTSALFFDPKPRQLQSAASTSQPAGGVRNEVQVAGRILIVHVDRRRQQARSTAPARSPRRRPRRSRLADGRSSTWSTIPASRSARRAEEPPHAARLDGVVQHRRRAVEVHVADRRRPDGRRAAAPAPSRGRSRRRPDPSARGGTRRTSSRSRRRSRRCARRARARGPRARASASRRLRRARSRRGRGRTAARPRPGRSL